MLRHGVILAALLALAPPALAQGVAFGLVTGRAADTHFRIGQDIAALGASCGIAVQVGETSGSLENALALRDRPATQLGIVQSDVLDYLAAFGAEDAQLARVARSLRIALPLYDAEVHLLARPGIARLADLAGRRVAVGTEASDTGLTAQLLLDLTEVTPGERITGLAPEAAVAALAEGSIDAMFHVGGAPAALLQDPRLAAAGVGLVPLDDPVLAAVYAPAEIAAGTYGFQDGAVATVAVKTVLMAFDYVPTRNAYNRLSCAAIADLSNLIVTRLDRLRAEGHPKWRDVDLTEVPPGWEVSACVLDGLAPGYAVACGAAEDGAAPPAATGPNALFLERVCARIGC